MNLILSRHGNTFESGQEPVWAGAANDIPLTPAGREQAKRLAQALKRSQISLAGIYCGPLSRAKEYAQIVSKELGLSAAPFIDPRLQEIDYGQWSGLTNQEVRSRFGDQGLENWESKSIWPANAGWQGTADTMIREVGLFTNDLLSRRGPQDTILAVSSNGRLRYFLNLIQGEFERRVHERSFKVKTGHIGKIILNPHSVQLVYWNVDPQSLSSI